MRRIASVMAASCLFAAAAGSQASSAGQSEKTAPATEVRGLEFFMFDPKPTREERGPTFSVRAENGSRDPDTGIWTLEDTQAVVYSATGDPMTIRAAICYFDEANEIARLTGGVDVETTDMQLSVNEIEWNNERGEAVTKGPAILKRGETVLETSRVVINPSEEQILCYQTHGTISFAEENP